MRNTPTTKGKMQMARPVERIQQPLRRYTSPTLIKREKLDRIAALTTTSVIVLPENSSR